MGYLIGTPAFWVTLYIGTLTTLAILQVRREDKTNRKPT